MAERPAWTDENYSDLLLSWDDEDEHQVERDRAYLRAAKQLLIGTILIVGMIIGGISRAWLEGRLS
jgi:hypothetical protein